MMRFVTFEGIDGSGKSTVSKLVYEKMKKEGLSVVLTLEPTDSWIGRMVQKCIETKTDPFITAYTFIADRVEHCKQIQKWLDDGKCVLCDRYVESTYAYQGAQMQDFVDDPVKWLQELSKNRYITPDKTFIFIIDPKQSLDRIQNRDNLIPFEKIDFLKKVHNIYLDVSKGNRFTQVDATKSIDELVDICYNDIVK